MANPKGIGVRRSHNIFVHAVAAAAAGVLAVYIYNNNIDTTEGILEAAEQMLEPKEEHHLVNWSNTHECHPKRFYQPETQEELEKIVAEAHENGKTAVVFSAQAFCTSLQKLLIACQIGFSCSLSG